MNWDELERKHQKEWVLFEEHKDSAWQQIKKDKEAMYAAFGDREAKIPISVSERAERDEQEWRNAWEDDGYRAKYLLALQKAERETLKDRARSNILSQIKEAREKSNTRTKDRGWGD